VSLVVIGDHDGTGQGLGHKVTTEVGDGEDDLESEFLAMMTAVACNPHRSLYLEICTNGTMLVSIWLLPLLDLLGIEDDDPQALILHPQLLVLGLLDLLPRSSLPFARHTASTYLYLATALRLVFVVHRAVLTTSLLLERLRLSPSPLASLLPLGRILHGAGANQGGMELEHVWAAIWSRLRQQLRLADGVGWEVQPLDTWRQGREGHLDRDLSLHARLQRRGMNPQGIGPGAIRLAEGELARDRDVHGCL
jgi:hypothetical protein